MRFIKLRGHVWFLHASAVKKRPLRGASARLSFSVFRRFVLRLLALFHVFVFSVALGGFARSLREVFRGVFREGAFERRVADFAVEEVFVGHRRGLRVYRERLFLARVVAVEYPVARVDGALHLGLRAAHAALESVREAGRVGDDHGAAFVFLGLAQRLDELVHVGAHRDLRDVDVAVGHEHRAEVFFRDALAADAELRDRAYRRRLRGLASGV